MAIKSKAIPNPSAKIGYPKLVERDNSESIYLLLDAHKAIQLVKKNNFLESEFSLMDATFAYKDFKGEVILSNSRLK